MTSTFLCSFKKIPIDSMLPWVCVVTVINYRRLKNVVRILVTHLAVPFVSTFVFLLHFVVICDLLKTEQTT